MTDRSTDEYKRLQLLKAFMNVHSSDNDILGAYAHLAFDLMPEGVEPFTDAQDDVLERAHIEMRNRR